MGEESRYRVRGLISGALIFSVFSEVSEDGSSFAADYIVTPRTITIQAPVGVKVTVNGKEIPEEFISRTEIPDVLASAEKYVDDPAALNSNIYELPDIYAETLSVFGTDEQGNRIEADAKSDTARLLGWGGGEFPEARRTRLERFLKSYLYFSANVDNKAEDNWNSVLQYLTIGGDAFSRLYQSMEGLVWNSSNSVSLDNYEIESWKDLSDRCCVVRVSMDYTVNRRTGTTSESAVFDIVMVSNGYQYNVLSMEVVEN